MKQPDKDKIKAVMKKYKFLEFRKPLQSLGFKVDFAYEPVANYQITKGNNKKDIVFILNKKYADDYEFEHNGIVMGEGVDEALTFYPKAQEKVLRIVIREEIRKLLSEGKYITFAAVEMGAFAQGGGSNKLTKELDAIAKKYGAEKYKQYSYSREMDSKHHKFAGEMDKVTNKYGIASVVNVFKDEETMKKYRV